MSKLSRRALLASMAAPAFAAGYRNFELNAEVMCRPGGVSSIRFHGMTVRINNGPERIEKTGSLVGVRNIYKAFARDGEWFKLFIAVRANQIEVRLNGMLLVDYIAPGPLAPSAVVLDRRRDVVFRNVKVKALPGNLAARECPAPDQNRRDLLALIARGFPVVDYHVHLKAGLTMEEALRRSRELGIGYGLAVNCGMGFSVVNDAAAKAYLDSMKGQPVFVAMQGEGREWVKLFSPQVVAGFDYVFTDAMTFTDDNGERVRLWMPAERGRITEPRQFMDMLVNRITGILRDEPIDIYVNPTFLPADLAPRYDELWTPARMDRVIEAAVANGVAIEINNRYRLPGAAFIRRAKAAGARFAFGTNNTSAADLGSMQYAIEMVRECGLQPGDIFIPKPAGHKPVERKS